MNCKEFQNHWVDRLEKSLPPSEEAQWQTHFHSCETCRREVEEWEFLERELKEMPVPSFPEVFWNRQREAIRSKIHSPAPRVWEGFWQTLFQPRGILAGALAVLILFFGYQYGSHRFFKLQPPRMIADQEEALIDDIGGEEEDSPFDLTSEQENRYYAFLAQKYLPEMEDSEVDDPIDTLTHEELDQVLKHFEQDALRRTL